MATIAIHLNGEPREVAAGQLVRDLVAGLNLGNQALAVAINREIVPRQKWPERTLLAGDKVEIVRAIGGG
ncbi:MAG TPA: sulfur carrier protein ThiS [Burkholderiaceae bacterium]